LVGKFKGKLPLGRRTRNWENIKLDIKELEYEIVGLDSSGSV